MSSSLSILLRYGVATVVVAAAVAVTAAVPPLRERNQFMLFVSAVAVSAWCGGWGPSLVSAALSAVSANVFIMQPRGAFSFGVENLERIAAFFAIAILISFLQARRQRAEQEVRANAEEMYVARLIQQKLLPSAAPSLPGFDIAGMSRPARSTGGDYFDFIPLSDGRLAVALGDVSGHGLGPALIMAETRANLRAAVKTHTDPGEILTVCNRTLCEDLEGDRFVTLFLATLDPGTRELRYASAGQEAYLLDETGDVTKLENHDLPLGINRDQKYDSRLPILLKETHILVFLTDGVTETMCAQGRLFGLERALQVIQENRQRSPGPILDELWQIAQKFRNGKPQIDDFSAIVVKAIETPAELASAENIEKKDSRNFASAGTAAADV